MVSHEGWLYVRQFTCPRPRFGEYKLSVETMNYRYTGAFSMNGRDTERKGQTFYSDCYHESFNLTHTPNSFNYIDSVNLVVKGASVVSYL